MRYLFAANLIIACYWGLQALLLLLCPVPPYTQPEPFIRRFLGKGAPMGSSSLVRGERGRPDFKHVDGTTATGSVGYGCSDGGIVRFGI